MYDPLDKAVERLWLSGVVVVAAGQLRRRGSAERRAVRAGQRSVRDHGRRGRHRRLRLDERRLRCSVVGLRLHARRLREARHRGARPVHGRPCARRLDPRHGEADERRRPRLHPALRHLVRGSGRRRRRRPDPLGASHVDARPGQGRAHADGAAGRRLGSALGTASAWSTSPRRSRVGERPEPERRPEQVRHHATSRAAKAFDAASWASTATANASWASASWTAASWRAGPRVLEPGQLGERLLGLRLLGLGLLGERLAVAASWASASWARPPGRTTPRSRRRPTRANT